MAATDLLTIAATPPVELGLNPQKLYDLGLEHVRRLAKKIWTDHNVHDPGVTTLELLCYALTDLTNRASLPIEDLLADGGVTASSLFDGASALLPNEPLTPLDYRKLAMDVPHVRNAWIAPDGARLFGVGDTLSVDRPAAEGVREFTLGGLYRVQIEYEPSVKTAQARDNVKAAVLAALNAHRNLAEDFIEVVDIAEQPFLLCGELDLAPGADVDGVHESILRQVHDYLAPSVRRYSLAGMLARRKADGSPFTAPDLFEGPRLTRGFIDGAELEAAELRTSLRLSDVQRIVMNVPGVLAIRDMLIAPKADSGQLRPLENRWVVGVDPGRRSTLDPAGSRLIYYKRNLPVTPRAVTELGTASSDAPILELAIPRGLDRNVAGYTSVQHHFPAVYGISEQGLVETAPRRRKAQARQLQSYLLFFDQVMANYCAQLRTVSALFSSGASSGGTYASQVVSSVSGYAALYTGDSTSTDAAIAKALAAIAETPAGRIERRQRFLDHLIARFAERFHDYASIMHSAFGATDESLLEDRRAFLGEYAALSGSRSRGYNHASVAPTDRWNSANVSGVEKRVARLLGIADSTRRNLTEPRLDVTGVITTPAAGQFGFNLRIRDAADQVEPLALGQSNTFGTAAAAQRQLLRALELGQWNSTFERHQQADGRWSFSIVAKDGEIVATGSPVASADALETAIVETRTFLRRHHSREGMLLIENLLLRPERAGDKTLHACQDPNCAECGADDPYSFRVHVVMPAFAGRFNNMDFRRFAEDVIREEMPAHLMPRICWVGEAQMTAVQDGYHAWLDARSGADLAERQKRLAALVELLENVKSVYPVQKLVACSDTSGKPRFILGRSALGSETDND